MHKNLNDIIPPSRRRAMMGDEGAGTTLTQDVSATPPPAIPPRPPKNPMMRAPKLPSMGGGAKRGFPMVTAIVALVVVLLSVGALFAFSGAKVAITPTKSPISVTSTFTSTQGSGDLPFAIVTVEKTATASVPAESTENVTQAAQGTIVVSNQQDAPQALIKNTRFETPDGLVFRIRDSITVPAAKNGQPGTLPVTVYADEAGEQYNVPATTFTLPGLAGSATFDLVTARSSDSMKGGFSGARPTVSTATKDAEYAKLESTLNGELMEEIASQIPEGQILIPGATAITIEEQPDTAGAGNTVVLSAKGIVRGVIFPEQALASQIAFQTVGTYAGEPLTFEDVSGLTLAPAEGLIPTDGEPEFTFTLTGNSNLIWKVDETKVAGAVAGKNRQSAQVLLDGFPEVGQALLVLKPFWKSSFPEDPAKIDVEVEGQQEGE